MTSGVQNTAIGGQVGYDLTTADYVTLLGYRAGYNITTSGYNASWLLHYALQCRWYWKYCSRVLNL